MKGRCAHGNKSVQLVWIKRGSQCNSHCGAQCAPSAIPSSAAASTAKVLDDGSLIAIQSWTIAGIPHRLLHFVSEEGISEEFPQAD